MELHKNFSSYEPFYSLLFTFTDYQNSCRSLFIHDSLAICLECFMFFFPDAIKGKDFTQRIRFAHILNARQFHKSFFDVGRNNLFLTMVDYIIISAYNIQFTANYAAQISHLIVSKVDGDILDDFLCRLIKAVRYA